MKRKLTVVFFAILACAALVMGMAACGEHEKAPVTNGTGQGEETEGGNSEGGSPEDGQGDETAEEAVYKFDMLAMTFYYGAGSYSASYKVGDTVATAGDGPAVLTEDYFVLKMRADGTATILCSLAGKSADDETAYTVDPGDPQTFYLTYNMGISNFADASSDGSIDFTCKLEGSTMTLTGIATVNGMRTQYVYTLHAVSE